MIWSKLSCVWPEKCSIVNCVWHLCREVSTKPRWHHRVGDHLADIYWLPNPTNWVPPPLQFSRVQVHRARVDCLSVDCGCGSSITSFYGILNLPKWSRSLRLYLSHCRPLFENCQSRSWEFDPALPWLVLGRFLGRFWLPRIMNQFFSAIFMQKNRFFVRNQLFSLVRSRSFKKINMTHGSQ